MEIPYAKEHKLVPKNLSWALRTKKAYRLFKRTIPFWYLLSALFAVFVYITKGADISLLSDVETIIFEDKYEQETSYTDRHAFTSLKKPTLFEDFPYDVDTTVLPIAPYRHVQDKLDLRATIVIYLETLKTFVRKATSAGGSGTQPPVLNFHWKDFVDLNILKPLLQEKPNCFRIGALGSTSRIPWSNCLDEPQNLGFVFITPSLEPETEFRLSIRGKSYLYTAAPLPNKLIFLAGELAFVTKIGKRMGLEEGTMIDEYVQRKMIEQQTLTQEQIMKLPINPSDEIDNISKALGRGLINFESEKTIQTNVDKSLFQVQSTKEKAQLANAARHNDDRHFRNVMIKSKDGKWASEEFYDWRFFNKKLNNLNKRKALHGVVENYLQLCSNLGISTWVSSESMTSWKYNGLIGPWEDTVRFELPAADLARIANSFNYTLIVSDPRNGTGSYLIDISPWYLERARYHDGGASPDIADGRVIDLRTGVYVELFGAIRAPRVPEKLMEVAKTSDVSEFVITGKGNFWYLPDLLPLNRTLYEGKQANVPKTFPTDSPLPPENYVFRDHLRLFVDEKKCTYVPEEEKEKFDLTYIGCCHDDLIWKEYNSTKFATAKFLEVDGSPINVADEVDMHFS
jgi:hypothetical protein